MRSTLSNRFARQSSGLRTARLWTSSLRIAVFVMVYGLIPGQLQARQAQVNLTSRQQPVQVKMMAIYQSYEEEGPGIDQISFPVSVMVPLGTNMNITVQASQTSATGDDVESVSGMSDTYVSLGYSRTLGTSSLIFSLGLSLPSGKRELSREEFQTLILLSQTAFDFRVPGLGQGFGVSPAATFALPISEDFVFGAGVSYRVRNGFKPIDGMDDDYTPGNELLLTTGLDTKIGTKSSLSLDVTYTVYSADQLGDTEVLEAGSKTRLTALFRHVNRYNEWRVLGLYRVRAKSSQLGGGALATGAVQTVPNEMMMQVVYGMRLSSRVRISLLAEGRFFDRTPAFQAREVFDLGVLPTFRLSQETSLVSRFVYTTGTITGFEGGVGLTVSL